MNRDSLAVSVAPEISADEVYQRRIRQLEEEVAALSCALAEKERVAEGYLAAYNERVGHLEAEVAALTEAAVDREKRAATEIAAYQQAYTERVGHLESHVAALTEAAVEGVPDGYLAAYNERVGHLETEVAALTEAAVEREKRTATEIAAYQQAYTERVGHLESHVAALTEAAVERERQSQESRERDYQLVMIHQGLLAGLNDLDPDFFELYERCKRFTMTSMERLYSLYKAVEYLTAGRIGGDFAECGVWRGGSCMMMALGLIRATDTSRSIYMYDTFEGHPAPDPEKDVDLWGNGGVDEYRRQKVSGARSEWGAAPRAEVRDNLLSTHYPESRLIFVQGNIETTVPENIPEKLALLRLDSDWYESTRVALRHLYPRLVEGGVLIIDDYGHYRGQRQAVDEYFVELDDKPFLHRIDYSCRVMVKRAKSS